jgi:hypothetical protein
MSAATLINRPDLNKDQETNDLVNPEHTHRQSLPPAHSLRDAANTDNTLEGYAAMNAVPLDSVVAEEVLEHPFDEHAATSKLAYDFYLERGGRHGAHEDDWYRAEREIRSRHQPGRESTGREPKIRSTIKMTATTATKTVVGVFDNIHDANSAVSALENAGFSRDDISVIANKNASAEYERTEQGKTDKTSVVASDAGIGAALGGVGGLLWSFAALAIPGVGPVLALGPLAAALGGAGIGAVAGGIIGALTESGIPESEASNYAEVVRRGQVLVSVRTDGMRADQAREILDDYGPLDVEGRSSAWRERGWSGYDPGAEPLSADELRREREYYGSVSSAKADPSLTGKTAWPHEEAYPIGESLVETESEPNTTASFGDSTLGTRPSDRASKLAERGFERANESAVRSARRMASRVYDVRR